MLSVSFTRCLTGCQKRYCSTFLALEGFFLRPILLDFVSLKFFITVVKKRDEKFSRISGVKVHDHESG